jgi:hypothetical protein
MLLSGPSQKTLFGASPARQERALNLRHSASSETGSKAEAASCRAQASTMWRWNSLPRDVLPLRSRRPYEPADRLGPSRGCGYASTTRPRFHRSMRGIPAARGHMLFLLQGDHASRSEAPFGSNTDRRPSSTTRHFDERRGWACLQRL